MSGWCSIRGFLYGPQNARFNFSLIPIFTRITLGCLSGYYGSLFLQLKQNFFLGAIDVSARNVPSRSSPSPESGGRCVRLDGTPALSHRERPWAQCRSSQQQNVTGIKCTWRQRELASVGSGSNCTLIATKEQWWVKLSVLSENSGSLESSTNNFVKYFAQSWS